MQTLLVPGLLVLVFIILLVVKRKKIRELRRKYAKLWRDLTRILTINISYAQVNGSLGTVIPVAWPPIYLEFLKTMQWTDFDVFSLFSVGCVGDIDYRNRALFACCVPLLVIILAAAYHGWYAWCHKVKDGSAAVRTSAVLYL
jgi:hypothetical protein